MKNYRIGNTITVKWTLKTEDGSPYALDAQSIELYATSPNHKTKIKDFTTSNNVLTWIFGGDDQKYLGPYTLTLVQNRGKVGMVTVDSCDAFCLVQWSCLSGGSDSPNVDTESINLESTVSLSQVGLSPEVQEAIDETITEYNVSARFPTDGIDGTNRYTLETAIAKIPSSLRTVGIKCSFLNEGGQVETWAYEGGSWNQVSPPKFMGKVKALNDINVLSDSISAGAYTFNANTSNITGLPDGFSGYGWLIVIHSNLRILIGNSHPDRLYIKTSSDWEDFSKLTISQTTGHSDENLMSQKAITENLLIVKGGVEDVTLNLELGTYTCSSAAQNLPLDFPDNSFGFLVVLNKNFRLLFLQNKGIVWSKHNDGKWHNMLETAVPAISAGMQIISTLINEAVKNNLFDLETEEISADETTEGAVIHRNTGKIQTGVDDNYVVKKYNVNGAKACRIISSTQFQNALFAVFDADDNLLSIKVPADSAAAESEDICITPSNASYVLVGFSTSIREGGLYNFKIVQHKHPGKWSGLKWVVVGDSLTEENVRTTKHYFDYIAEGTGIQVTNMGVSGSGYKRRDDEGKAFYQRVNSISTDADVITIFGSFNDFGASPYNLGEPTDTDTDTICGCINTTIETILNAYLAVGKIPRIGVVTPTPWQTTLPADPDSRGVLYCDAVIQCCRQKSIPVLDLYRCSNLHPDNETFRTLAYSKDDGNGVHPDETGHKIIAPQFETFLNKLLYITKT